MNDSSLALVEAAIRAPSSHNTQPWLFRVRDEAIEVHADRLRALPINDPHDRELTISCGAALLNLQVAAARAGIGTETTLLPDPSHTDHLATVSFRGEPDATLGALADAISTRRSTRSAFEDRPVPSDLGVKLLVLAEQHDGCHAVIVDTPLVREKIAGLVGEGDKAQFDNKDWRRELAHWLRPRSEQDGLTTPKLVAPFARAAVRHFDLGGFVADTDEDLARDAPLLLVLWTDLDEPGPWIETGRYLEAISLQAGLADVQTGYLNQPCQVSDLRPRLREILAIPRFPQIVVRFGHAPGINQFKPRRPVEDVLLADPGTT